MTESHFTESCVPVRYPCAVGRYFVDPCDCRKYFRCSTIFSVVQQTCAAGTAFDHVSESCFFEQEIYANDSCLPITPWTRCEQVHPSEDVDLEGLRRRCLNTTDDRTTASPGTSVGETTINIGAIAGGAVAGVIVLGLVLAVALFIRRGRPLSDYKFPRLWKPSSKSVSNPAYDHEPEEHYAEITDLDIKAQGLEPPPPQPPPQPPERPPHTLTHRSTPLPPKRNPDGSRTRLCTPPPVFTPGWEYVYDLAYNPASPAPPEIAVTPPAVGYEEPRPLPEYFELCPDGHTKA